MVWVFFYVVGVTWCRSWRSSLAERQVRTSPKIHRRAKPIGTAPRLKTQVDLVVCYCLPSTALLSRVVCLYMSSSLLLAGHVSVYHLQRYRDASILVDTNSSEGSLSRSASSDASTHSYLRKSVSVPAAICDYRTAQVRGAMYAACAVARNSLRFFHPMLRTIHYTG